MSARRPLPIAAFLAALIAWAAAAIVQPELARRREAEHLSVNVREKNLPPELAIVAVLGSFRGWFINYLWIRATQLQDRGEFHEALQLTTWITRLQPRYARVWFFHSYNMATNLSMASTTKEERGLWIEEAIRLLRDGALEHNPFDARLHRDLAAIFTNRIEGQLDRTHWHYKYAFAKEWHRLLGAPPHGGAGREAFVRWLEPLAHAPVGSDREVVAACTLLDPELGALLSDLASEARPFSTDFCARLVELSAEDPVRRSALSPAESRLFAPGAAAERGLLVAAARARVLREVEKMDPALMLEVTRTFGPLDWRAPSAHALYWAVQGELRREFRALYPRLSPERMLALAESSTSTPVVRTALRALLDRGRVVWHERGDFYTRLPEPEFAEALEVSLETIVPDVGPDYAEREYRRSLWAALESAACHGLEDECRRLVERLAQSVSGATGMPAAAGDPVSSVVVWQVDEIDAMPLHLSEEEQVGLAPEQRAQLLAEQRLDMARAAVIVRLLRALQAEADDQPAAARRFRGVAAELARVLRERGMPPAGAEPDAVAALRLEALRAYFLSAPAVVDPYSKRRLWNGPYLTDADRRAVYAEVRASVENDFRQAGIDVANGFPAPGP